MKEENLSELNLARYYYYNKKPKKNIITINEDKWVSLTYLQARYEKSYGIFAKAFTEEKDQIITSDHSTILHALAVSLLPNNFERIRTVLEKYPELSRAQDIYGRTPIYYCKRDTDMFLFRMTFSDLERKDYSGFTAIQYRLYKENYNGLIDWINKSPDCSSLVLHKSLENNFFDILGALLPHLKLEDEIYKANLTIAMCMGIPKHPSCNEYFQKVAEIKPELHSIFFCNDDAYMNWCETHYFNNNSPLFTKFLMRLIVPTDDFFEIRLKAFDKIFDHLLYMEDDDIIVFIHDLSEEYINRYLPFLPGSRFYNLTKFFILNDSMDKYFSNDVNFTSFIMRWLFIYKATNAHDDVTFFRHKKVIKPDTLGRTIFHWACIEELEFTNNNKQTFTNVHFVQWCLQLSLFPINVQDFIGNTPLHFVRNFMPDVRQFLLDNKACDDIPDAWGDKAMHKYRQTEPSSLKCLATQTIVKSKRPIDDVPEKTKKFIKLHDRTEAQRKLFNRSP